ncbi:MAG: efflux RND transporter permease subunit [Clostridia bacterium]
MNNRHPLRIQTAYLLALVLIVLGFTACAKMNTSIYPDYSLPVYHIDVPVPGMTAEWAEEKVARPLEDRIRELSGLDKVTTITRSGSISITVKGKPQLGTGDLGERIEAKLDEAAVILPIDRKTIRLKQDRALEKPLTLLMLHGADLRQLDNLSTHAVKEQLSLVKGVSRVEVTNGLANKVELVFRPTMLTAYHLTPTDILQQLQQYSAENGIGTIGEDTEQTRFFWTSQKEAPEALGKTLISTEKGSVALKLLADIKDMRGSQAEEITLYKGEPTLQIRVYGKEEGSVNTTAEEVSRVVNQLNLQGNGKYLLEIVENNVAPLSDSLKRMLWFSVITTIAASVWIGYRQRQIVAGVLSALMIPLVSAGVFGGMWLGKQTINLTSIGAIAIVHILALGAVLTLCMRYARLKQRNQGEIDQATKPLIVSLTWPFVALLAFIGLLLVTDFLKGTDMPTLIDIVPVLLLGAISLALVCGYVLPTFAAIWLNEQGGDEAASYGQRIGGANWLIAKWTQATQRRFVPYFMTMLVAALVVVFFRAFVTVEPFLQTDSDKITTMLPMIKGSTEAEAAKAAKAAEEKLRTLSDVRDLYVTATKQELAFTIYMEKKADRIRTKREFEKALDQQLREIPQTDPYSLVVGEDDIGKLEFTVKGVSLNTAQDIANQMVDYLSKLRMKDKDDNRLITNVKAGERDDTTYINMVPRQEMLARYQISDAEVKHQLESYLGEQQVANVRWNDQNLNITAMYPKKEMEHPDQVKNVLIRTPGGAVRLGELVNWRVGKSPAVYKREDGMYLMKVVSDVSDKSRIPSLSYYLPIIMKDIVTIPEGYTILSGEDIRKQEKEESEKADNTTRLLFSALAICGFSLLSLFAYKSLRQAFIGLLLLPLVALPLIIGLLWFNRPLNIMAVSGAAAVTAILLQQSYVLVTHWEQQASDKSQSLLSRIKAGLSDQLPAMMAMLAILAIGLVPLFFVGHDFASSYVAVLAPGLLLASWTLLVLVPGMYLSLIIRAEQESPITMRQVNQQLRAWWQNARVSRKDRREWKKRQEERKAALRKEQNKASSGKASSASLTADDFTPISELLSKEHDS